MEAFLKTFSFFILGLILMWMVFVVFVLRFKSQAGKKSQDFNSFQDRYSDLDEVIARKRQEAKKT